MFNVLMGLLQLLVLGPDYLVRIGVLGMALLDLVLLGQD